MPLYFIFLQAMTNSIARRPGLVICDHIYIGASKFTDKNSLYHKRASNLETLILGLCTCGELVCYKTACTI
jgi:hypothetical protein